MPHLHDDPLPSILPSKGEREEICIAFCGRVYSHKSTGVTSIARRHIDNDSFIPGERDETSEIHAPALFHMSTDFFTISGRSMCDIIVMAAVLHTIVFHVSYRETMSSFSEAQEHVTRNTMSTCSNVSHHWRYQQNTRDDQQPFRRYSL